MWCKLITLVYQIHVVDNNSFVDTCLNNGVQCPVNSSRRLQQSRQSTLQSDLSSLQLSQWQRVVVDKDDSPVLSNFTEETCVAERSATYTDFYITPLDID